VRVRAGRSDDVDVAGGHDGCDTRNQVLHSAMSAVTTKPGTHGCVVMSGALSYPYTGATIVFTKADLMGGRWRSTTSYL